MILSQTPFRISFFGGGTDYPQWYRQNGGAVLSTTINKYCYITVRQLPNFFPHKYRLIYSQREDVNDVEEIRHPAIKGVFHQLEVRGGLEVHHDADLPARSGIGSSSSFTVGLINALTALRRRTIDKRALAEMAIHIEQDVIPEVVGSQDQIAAAYGGFNRINFLTNGDFVVKPLPVSTERLLELNRHLLLFFTGVFRSAPSVAKCQIDNMAKCEQHLRDIRDMVDQAETILRSDRSLLDFGKLLGDSWKIKRELSSRVSTPEIDGIFETARSAGAVGGKLLGAGGGGFVLFFAPPELHFPISEKLHRLTKVDFRFENAGSQVVFQNEVDAQVMGPNI